MNDSVVAVCKMCDCREGVTNAGHVFTCFLCGAETQVSKQCHVGKQYELPDFSGDGIKIIGCCIVRQGE